jgi:murein tripeptide amidase MpaA
MKTYIPNWFVEIHPTLAINEVQELWVKRQQHITKTLKAQDQRFGWNFATQLKEAAE